MTLEELDRGKWDPQAKTSVQQWWPTPADQLEFIESLRGCLGLSPVRRECGRCLKLGRPCSKCL